MLQQEYLSVINVQTRDGFRAEVVKFADRLGFEIGTSMMVIDHAGRSSEFFSADNTSPTFKKQFCNDERALTCPVTQHIKHCHTPIVWNQRDYVAVGRGPQWEEQEPFGFGTGIAVALHLPYGRHFAFGVDRRQPLPLDQREIIRMVAAVQLFAVHALSAAERVLVPTAQVDEAPPNLTPRELECLRWTMEGKTAWESGRILGISEHTAIRHVNNATHKLGCVNKHQAVLKALRSKLIW